MCKSKSIKLIKLKLQNFLDKLSSWSEKTGFKFSKEKTVAIAFNRRRKPEQLPNLILNENQISYKNSHKFLGIINI